jgi:hypothetical protein
VGVDEQTARDRLETGLGHLTDAEPGFLKRERYYDGDQDLPYAPPGVNAEYLALREMSIANWIALASNAPVQRVRPNGFRITRDAKADQATWDEVWDANNLDARWPIVATQMMNHSRGVMSVWRNPRDARSPIVRPESVRRVWLEPSIEDPFSHEWAVKATSTIVYDTSSGVPTKRTRDFAWVYDTDGTWVRFERPHVGSWQPTTAGDSGLGDLPFVAFDNNLDADGKPRPSIIDQLIPAQDGINTIRFNTLLAMQFSAYRQRVFTGFDPVMKDDDGNVIWQRDAENNIVLDAQGQPMPVVVNMGRASVDRALVFPGADTKVFDLPESNLSNYIEALSAFLTDFFGRGQIPPQYLLDKMANLSGDALTGAESTLSSLIADLKRWSGGSLKQVMRLSARARGDDLPEIGGEVNWADDEARSFAQVVDGIQKLISVGYPREGAFEMLPNMTPHKLQRIMDMVGAESQDPTLERIARDLIATAPPTAPINADTTGV